jgi:hypothetical protein
MLLFFNINVTNYECIKAMSTAPTFHARQNETPDTTFKQSKQYSQNSELQRE